MPELIYLFPGQGSQYVGMGRDLAAEFPLAAQTFAEADAALGFPLSRLCFAGPEEELRLTANTQPAILAHSVAVARVLESRGLKPVRVAGHSLGEYSALVAAGGLEFADALRAVRRRGELMQTAVPVGEGSMAAILGMSVEAVTALCADAAAGQAVCEPANFNGGGQIVIAGHAAAVARAAALATERGGRAVPLPVSAPFHCRLMMPAQKGLEPVLHSLTFRRLRCPLLSNVDAEPLDDPETARQALIRQVTSPVQWEKTMRHLLAHGEAVICELGPGRVLCGLVRRMDRSRKCFSLDGAESVRAALPELGAA